MADTNLDLRELQESIRELSQALGSLSGVSAQAAGAGTALTGLTAATNSSSAAERDREKVLAAAARSTRDGLNSLAKAAGAAGAAMYNNQKGASAFNDTIDQGANAVKAFGVALMLLGGPIGLVVGGLMQLVGSGAKLVKTINQQSDAVYKGFQDLSRSGGAASDGMTGLFADVQKLGLGFQDLATFTSLIGESSKELALFGGSVFNGRKRFADMGQAMEPFRESLMNAGMTQEEINAASMGYLRLQSRIGQTQNKTANELADGARKYLIEQDALTKLTGMTRKEQEDAREEIRSQERFAATLMEMRNSGDAKQIAAAQELEDSYLILRSQSKEAAQGFADVSTGMLTTEAAQKSYLATQGESMRTAERIKAGELNAVQGAQQVAKAHGRTVDAMGATLGKMGTYNSLYGDLAADLRLKGMSEADIETQLKKIKEDQINQGVTGKKAADGATQAQTDMRLSQQKAMLALQRMVNHGVEPVTSVMAKLARVVEQVTLGFTKFLNMIGMGPEKEKTKEEQEADDAVEKRKREIMDLEWKVVNAKSEYDKKIAAAELKAAKSKLLDAEVAQKYAKDRATGAGAGPGGAQLRADGSVINRGDEDYVAPKPAATSGGMDMPSGGGGPTDISYKDYIKFTGGTGSEAHFDKLQPAVKAAFAQMARDYNQATGGEKLQVNSAFRSPEEQAGVDSGSNPKAAPGKSKHNIGMAVDIQSSQVRELRSLGLLSNYGFKTLDNDPPHIFMRDGGIASGPDSGYPATLHGTEAVIPLKNGSVPVSLSMTDIASASMFGKNRGDAAGQMRGEIAALKNMALSIAGSSQANKPVSDVRTWQEMVKSGLSNNYENGLAEITSKMLPDIGNSIGEQIKEITKNADSTTTTAIGQMTKDLKQSLTDVVKSMVPQDAGFSVKQLELMSAMIAEQKNSNSIQEKLLRAAAS